MRSSHKARRLAADHTRELVLQHPRGADILAACSGDAEHALRILEELKRPRGVGGEVIRLPLEPILDFQDAFDHQPPMMMPAAPASRPFVWSALLGALLWLVLAGVAFGVVELVRWLG